MEEFEEKKRVFVVFESWTPMIILIRRGLQNEHNVSRPT